MLPDQTTNKPLIYLIDDEVLLAESIGLNLKDRFEVQIFSSGETALNQLSRKNAKTPSACVTDIKMPGMDGLELIRRIRTEKSEVVIIIMSAYVDKEYAMQALEEKVCAIIEKPVDPEILANSLSLHTLQNKRVSKEHQMALLLENLSQTSAKLASLYRTRFVRAETIMLDHGIEIIEAKSDEMESFLKNAEEEFELEERVYDLQTKIGALRIELEEIEGRLLEYPA